MTLQYLRLAFSVLLLLLVCHVIKVDTIFTETPSKTSSRSRSRSGGSETSSGTASFSESLSITFSPSPTDSIALPVFQPQVYLRSPVTVPARCLMAELDTNEYRVCRTVIFSMLNDGFAFNSQRLSRTVMNQVAVFVSGDTVNPFGIQSSWPFIVSRSLVDSNVTHIAVTLPRRASLFVAERSIIAFNWSIPNVALRGEPATPNSSFEIAIEPYFGYETSTALLWVQSTAGLVGIATALLPVASPIVETQIAVLAGAQLCTQPDIRDVSLQGRRFVYPTAPTRAPASQQLQHNIVATLSFGGLHLVAVLFTMAKNNATFWAAAASVMFPSLTFSVAMFLHPGVTNSSFSLIVSSLSSRADRAFGFFGLLCAVAMVVSAPLLTLRFFKAAHRGHELALHDFPPVIAAFTPTSSWGPWPLLGSWLVPVGAMSSRTPHHCTCSFVLTTFIGIIMAIEPATPRGCASLFALTGVAHIVFALYLVRVQPYRSVPMNVSGAINAAFLGLPLFASIPRCLAEDSPPIEALWVMFVVVHAIALVRSIGTLVGSFCEWQLVRRRVWPDDDEGDEARPCGDDDDTVKGLGIGRERAPDVHLVALEDAAELATFEPEKSKVRIQSGTSFGLAELGSNSGASTGADVVADECVLGPPPPLHEREIPKPGRRAAKTNTMLRHPMINLLRNDGPIPAEVQQQQELEYSLL